eukprot:2444872-Prymnesium_polylepis.1
MRSRRAAPDARSFVRNRCHLSSVGCVFFVFRTGSVTAFESVTIVGLCFTFLRSYERLPTHCDVCGVGGHTCSASRKCYLMSRATPKKHFRISSRYGLLKK